MKTLYEHAGGDEAIHKLEDLFYDKVLADRILNSLFTERVPTHVDHLTWFTAESFGGPDRFTRQVGFQYIIDVHRRLHITDEQRDRFVTLYLESLDEAGFLEDEPFRNTCNRIWSSARRSPSRTRGRRPTPISTQFVKCRAGPGRSHRARK